ncbi:hypothetical protein [Polyangium jinanense]|nr:hypothetical protein [Polyangium jinanense]
MHIVGSPIHAENWIPAEQLESFNGGIVSTMEVSGRGEGRA